MHDLSMLEFFLLSFLFSFFAWIIISFCNYKYIYGVVYYFLYFRWEFLLFLTCGTWERKIDFVYEFILGMQQTELLFFWVMCGNKLEIVLNNRLASDKIVKCKVLSIHDDTREKKNFTLLTAKKDSIMQISIKEISFAKKKL